jgi:hypothetical protein
MNKRTGLSIRRMLMQAIVISLFYQLSACKIRTSIEQTEFKIEFSEPAIITKPELRDNFDLELDSFESIRLYHINANDKVKYANPSIKDITNVSLIRDLHDLLRILKAAKIESHHLGGTPEYNTDLEIQVLFMNFNVNSFKGIFPTFELFLADDGNKFTVREYYYANAATYYTLDTISSEKVISALEHLISEYTSFDKEVKTWLKHPNVEIQIERKE